MIGVAEDGGVEMYSHDLSQNRDVTSTVDVRPDVKPAQAAVAEGYSHGPPKPNSEAPARSEVTQTSSVNGGSYHSSGSRAAAAGHSTVAIASDSIQDLMLQSMLSEVSTSQQPSLAQNGFHSARKQSAASSTEEAPAHSAAQDGGSGSRPVNGLEAAPDMATLKHQQYLEAFIKKMQLDHDAKVCTPDIVSATSISALRKSMCSYKAITLLHVEVVMLGMCITAWQLPA